MRIDDAYCPLKEIVYRKFLGIIVLKNTSGSLGELQMLWDHEPTNGQVFLTAFEFFQLKLFRVYLYNSPETQETYFLFSGSRFCDEKTERAQIVFLDRPARSNFNGSH